MAALASADVPAWLIPPEALTEWRHLAVALEEAGTVPCRGSDPEAWWPDRKHLDAPSTRLAVHGCWRCPAREPCLAYAVAAGEREGVWGGMLPEERQEDIRSVA
ncbi:transcriptional regulator WhiB2 [Blastococcus jejuensis]|uniref:Transcriptional regulator WhiB n=1 Tax=Blastococcus jejuensis TaxID=351224 RepID=A0ABP6PAD7_9ACTN